MLISKLPMKQIFILSLIILSWISLNAQVISIENTSFEYALPTIPNYLTIVVENNSCANLLVETNNGTIAKEEGKESVCRFVFIPEKIGKATLHVYKLKGIEKQLLGKREYIIRKWPEQKATFAKLQAGSVEKGEFLAYSGVHIPISEGLEIDAKIPVKSYLIKVVRDGSLFLDLANNGESLEIKNRQLFDQVKSGDVVSFENIVARMPGESYDRKMNDVTIVIK